MFKKSALALLTSAIAFLPAQSVFANKYGTAIFDVTGSMQTVRSADTLTRCEFGKDLFLETIKSAINSTLIDHLDVRTFDVPGNNKSISGGFVDVSGMNTASGSGKALFETLESKVEKLSCNGGSTSLGDALCESIDNLRSQFKGGDTLRLAVVTDAAENSSRTCGGNNYVIDKVLPKLLSQPKVKFDVTVLNNKGNVDRSISSTSMEGYEEEAYMQAQQGGRGSVAEEISNLMLVAQLTGGEAAAVADTETCTSGCAPGDGKEAVIDDDLGGAW